MINVPMVDFYVSFENLGWLVDQASKELDTIQEIEKFSVNGWRGYGFSGQMPPRSLQAVSTARVEHRASCTGLSPRVYECLFVQHWWYKGGC